MPEFKADEWADRQDLPSITRPYLLCLNIKSYRDAGGVRYFDRLWLKDLLQHLRYLKNLTVACPCQRSEPPPDADAIAWKPTPGEIQFVDLPATDRPIDAVRHLASTATLIWQAIGRADIVHTGIAGWPIPFGWLATPMAVLRGKACVIVVESAPWRLRPGMPVTWKAKLRASVFETLSRFCVNRATLPIFTQEGYRHTLLTQSAHRGHIIQASWVDENEIISAAEAADSWRSKKLIPGSTLKFLFAGRLAQSKGLKLLLDAMELAAREKIPVALDILGQGELGGECEQASQTWGAGKIRILGTLPYGSRFFQLLRSYHAVAVPSLSDEQPRIVYDAYSQAVPILAADTPGLRECVEPGRTGMISDCNEPGGWVRLFEQCLRNREELEPMGMAGLAKARETTHAEMHRRRWRLLLNILDEHG